MLGSSEPGKKRHPSVELSSERFRSNRSKGSISVVAPNCHLKRIRNFALDAVSGRIVLSPTVAAGSPAVLAKGAGVAAMEATRRRLEKRIDQALGDGCADLVRAR